MRRPTGYIATVISILIFVSQIAEVANGAACVLPKLYQLQLYAMEDGKDCHTKIGPSELESNVPQFKGTCWKIVANNTKEENSVADVKVLYKNETNDCFFCYHLFSRSINVIQYRHTQCASPPDVNNPEMICSLQTLTELETGFSEARVDLSEFNCKSIMEGVYQFQYKFTTLTGMCNSPDSIISACQRQGSPLRDNNILDATFGYCESVKPVASIWVTKFQFRCYGRWVDENENIWAAVAYDTGDTRFKYRCLITRVDQQMDDNVQVWGLSNDANCKAIKTFFDAPVRLEIKPTIDPRALPQMEPGCKLPSNFTGQWFYPSEFNTEVTINATHIYYRRRMDKHRLEEIYFVCRQSQESRYLMATVTKGRCENDFVCFHFMPRHHNIIRFRMSRPFRQLQTGQESDYMVRMFREACHWNSFTLNYLEWTYEYYVLDPPVPINCPIQGQFHFNQHGTPAEKYITKIPQGVTPRPRVQVVCDGKWESSLSACLDNPKQLKLDIERCMRLDFTGRPISEYDVPDHVLTCVGYWMEDTHSLLITYDPEDGVPHHFRCWVYRRTSFHDYVLSRSLAGQCGKLQTAESNSTVEGASLMLEIYQNERLFDVCPMDYDDGRDPYGNPSEIVVFSSASTFSVEYLFPLSLMIVSYLTSNLF